MCAKSLQSCLTLCDPMEPTRLLCPWDSPGKNTRVGCHFPSPGDLPNPGMEPMSLMSPALAGKFFTTSATWDTLCGSAGKESACNMGDLGSIPGLGRSPGEGKGYPLQYSGLENSVDCIVHGVAKSRAQLSDFYSLTHSLTHSLHRAKGGQIGGLVKVLKY